MGFSSLLLMPIAFELLEEEEEEEEMEKGFAGFSAVGNLNEGLLTVVCV